jgi:glutamate N-acetyltransferase/amino-acid N-acetyltransferase
MLQEALSEVVPDTFNMVSIDGDTSTNDMVSIMASGLCGNGMITKKDDSYESFKAALFAVCEKVSKAIAFDGEGATKLLECKILNADTKTDAKKLAKSVIKSSLVKSMVFGADANGGRVLCALGYSGVEFDPKNVDAKFASAAGEVVFCEKGGITAFDEEKAKAILSREIIEIIVDMHSGKESAAAWGCDLSYEYVRINGDYRS